MYIHSKYPSKVYIIDSSEQDISIYTEFPVYLATCSFNLSIAYIINRHSFDHHHQLIYFLFETEPFPFLHFNLKCLSQTFQRHLMRPCVCFILQHYQIIQIYVLKYVGRPKQLFCAFINHILTCLHFPLLDSIIQKYTYMTFIVGFIMIIMFLMFIYC